MRKVSVINFTANILTLVGYMTLTLSLSLTSDVARHLSLSHSAVLSAISALFMIYSISAIILASASDVIGASKVLNVVQVISIIGLVIVSLAQNLGMLYLGFILMGIGTGPYASIARSFVSRHAINALQMKKSYSLLSICIVVAPLLSSLMARTLATESWRLAYIAMAVIELALLISCRGVLLYDKSSQKLIKLNTIIKNFAYIFSARGYAINLIMLVFVFSFYIQIIMANASGLLQGTLNMTAVAFNIVLCLITLFYILGILSYRRMTEVAHRIVYRFILLALFVIFAVLFSTLPYSALYLSIALILLSFCAGYIAPLSTGSAMLYIERGHGSAAAAVSFTVTFGVSVWTFIQAHLAWDVYDFMLLGLWVTVIGSVLITLIMSCFKRR
ncbi:MFS transporter [Fangia hongkongensis]|uniref:MFS transporter n=1 Tax=Fangia hongkongensis TaxID=270495 RepID=UPI0003740E12|nr:MFS transporter [Fangia hongkongensis]MBK2123877.1 MFS transporter [Fangia hongkongensis]